MLTLYVLNGHKKNTMIMLTSYKLEVKVMVEVPQNSGCDKYIMLKIETAKLKVTNSQSKLYYT